jgi:DNA repair exonuclease SbcCD nuclease subunit
VVLIERAAIACLPWPSKGSLLARLGDVSREEGNQVATEALRAFLQGFRADLARHQLGPRLFLGHVMMRGSVTSEAQPPLVGHDFELTLSDLALIEASISLLSHVHQPQQWEINGAPVAYAGSPRRCDWGEPEPKSYIVGEFEGSKLVSWERVPTPCTPMIRVTLKFERGSLVLSNEDANLIEQSPGAEVRLRYEVPADQRVAAAAAACDLAELLTVCGGAVDVQADPIVKTETRARAPEVAAAATLVDALDPHWRSVGFEPGDRRAALIEKARTLEVRSREA